MCMTTVFEHNGMAIHNPMLSCCGRFEVSPETYGFKVVETGGGCKAWRLDLEHGDYILLTDEDGISLPESWTTAIIGRYDVDGNVLVDAHKLEA